MLDERVIVIMGPAVATRVCLMFASVTISRLLHHFFVFSDEGSDNMHLLLFHFLLVIFSLLSILPLVLTFYLL
ncbi:hypothetical protein EV401DRAFT_2031046 [Pisolithus croceorrhizus]|nr:hypothetical protein EV401DRAFT_2031046 [Pisolithus croceorrhizus]